MSNTDKTLNTAKKDSGRLPKIVTLAKIYDGLINDIKKREDVPELPTGIKNLDEALWGLHRKQLL